MFDKPTWLGEDEAMKIPPKFTLPSHASRYRTPLLTGIVIVAVVAIAFLGWKFIQARQMLSDIKTKEAVSEQEVEKVTKEVGALIILPDETPTVATVTDKTKLAKNDFFQKAENGDKVLIYAQARRAYLYRPSAKQLVDVTPLNVQEDTTQEDTTQEATTSADQN